MHSLVPLAGRVRLRMRELEIQLGWLFWGLFCLFGVFWVFFYGGGMFFIVKKKHHHLSTFCGQLLG